jgi:peptidyl-prolyl cis-trans isomerase C
MTCAAHADLAKPSVVSVNGVVIPPEVIASEVQNHPAAKPIMAWQSAARALAIRELLLQEARRIGIDPQPVSDAEGRRETEDEALIRGVVEHEIVTPQADEETCRQYYMQNRHRFRSPAIFEAAHILFAARQGDTESFASAADAARAVLAELKSHPERFGPLARAHSACTSAAQDGNLGQITAGKTTPEFEQALFALSPGAITEQPVTTRYGLHIIRLDRKIEERDLPFEIVASRVADYLRESVQRRATAQYIARLVSSASITGVGLDGAAEQHRVN